MKLISGTLNNDFFYLVKDWLTNINSAMNLEPNANIEILYINNQHYIAYPVIGTINEAIDAIQSIDDNSIIHVEDSNIYVAARYNSILSDMYEFQLDFDAIGNI